MTYSQALEVQSNVRRLLQSRDGRAYLVGMLEDAYGARRVSSDEWVPDALADVMTRGVEVGEPYYWAPDICRLISDSAPSLPSYTLQQGVLPSDAGYFHLAAPLPLPAREIGPSDLVGIGWYWGQDFSRLMMTFFTNDCLSTHPGVPLPVSTGSWFVGQTWHECLGWIDRSGVVISYPNRTELMVRYVAACLAFIEQPFIGTEQQRPDRATRKRVLAETGHEPTIRVVQLRRASGSTTPKDGVSEPIQWSCQWPVRSHWRLQACGEGRSERRPVLVRPYIKGDPTKPLKGSSDRLFAVTR